MSLSKEKIKEILLMKMKHYGNKQQGRLRENVANACLISNIYTEAI